MEISNDDLNERGRFWNSSRNWPRNAKGYIFLARAVLEAAPYIVEDWSDSDPIVLGLFSPKPEHKASEAWGRWKKVIDAFRDAIADEELEFALVKLDGGDFVQQHSPQNSRFRGPKASDWNVDSADFRFALCRMNLTDPLRKTVGMRGGRGGFDPTGDHRIYLVQASFNKFLAKLQEPATAPTPKATEGGTTLLISEYLHVLLSTLQRLNLEAANLPKKEAMIVEIKSDWQRLYPALPFSETQAERMATICRTAESQKGRAAKANGDDPYKAINFNWLSDGSTP